MTWRVGKTFPINVYEDDESSGLATLSRPICQCHTALDAKRIVEAVNDSDADARDWKQIAEALGFGLPGNATREQIVEACRALKAAKP
jgi:hypothetical protein